MKPAAFLLAALIVASCANSKQKGQTQPSKKRTAAEEAWLRKPHVNIVVPGIKIFDNPNKKAIGVLTNVGQRLEIIQMLWPKVTNANLPSTGPEWVQIILPTNNLGILTAAEKGPRAEAIEAWVKNEKIWLVIENNHYLNVTYQGEKELKKPLSEKDPQLYAQLVEKGLTNDIAFYSEWQSINIEDDFVSGVGYGPADTWNYQDIGINVGFNYSPEWMLCKYYLYNETLKSNVQYCIMSNYDANMEGCLKRKMNGLETEIPLPAIFDHSSFRIEGNTSFIAPTDGRWIRTMSGDYMKETSYDMTGYYSFGQKNLIGENRYFVFQSNLSMYSEIELPDSGHYVFSLQNIFYLINTNHEKLQK